MNNPDVALDTLTGEQWRQARQAGSATLQDGTVLADSPYGQQLTFDTLGPAPGTLWRNVHTSEIATVIGTDQRRHYFVKLRKAGRETEIPLKHFTDHYEPFRHVGSVG